MPISFEKLENGYTKSEDKKQKYRQAILDLIEDEDLFVAPVQPSISGQFRSNAYKVIYPIYKSSVRFTNRPILKETLANCFSCSVCDKIFLLMPRNGTGPLTSHLCFKKWLATVKKAE